MFLICIAQGHVQLYFSNARYFCMYFVADIMVFSFWGFEFFLIKKYTSKVKF